MRHALLASAAAATLAAPAAARFAPPIGVPLRVESVQQRDDGAGPRRFAVTHDLVFARAPGGYRATLTLRGDSAADSGDTIGAFARLQSALAGQPVTAMLDRAGRIVAVDDLDALWARLRAAIAAVASGSPARMRTRDLLLAQHDAATPAQRIETIAGTLAAVSAGAEAERRAGERATTVPGIAFGRADAPLPARESVVRDGAVVRITTTAEGSTAAPGGGTARVALTRTREIDRATGLLRAGRETRETFLAIDGSERLLRAATTLTIAPVSQYPSENPRLP
jgi:hypothetical protein